MSLAENQLAAWHFTVALALGYCAPEAEQRYRDELPTMSLADRTFSATGFKQAINEALEASDAWTAHVRNRIDKALKARSLPTVEAMRAELERKKAKILKRGRILDEEEFSLVSDLLARPRSTLPPTRREKFSKLLLKYEKRPLA